MFRQLARLSMRTVLGVALGSWIVFLALTSLTAESAGPRWGIHLSATQPDGDPPRADGVSFGLGMLAHVHVGDQITSVDGADPNAYAGADLPGSVRDITVRDADASESVVQFKPTPASMLALLS